MSERIVVAAPYPTMPGPEAAATFDLVRRLVDEGHDVLVASPRPSAAHTHLDPGGVRGAVRLARLVAGRDRLIVRLDASALRVDGDRTALIPARNALVAAMLLVDAAELILDRVPDTVSPRWATKVVGRVERVTVSSDAERDRLVAAGVDAGKVDVVALPSRAPTAVAARSVAALPAAPSSAAAIEDLIRRRAGETRAAQEAGPAEVTAASRSLRLIEPLERPTIRSRKPAVASVKRAQLRVLAWMFDSVIQHVNRLHHATIEAIEAVEATSVDKGDAGGR